LVTPLGALTYLKSVPSHTFHSLVLYYLNNN